VRIQYVPGLTETSLAFYSTATQVAIWSTIEPGLGIIAGCLATLRPLLRRFISSARTMGTTSYTSQAQRNNESAGLSRSTLTNNQAQIDETASNPSMHCKDTELLTWPDVEKGRQDIPKCPSHVVSLHPAAPFPAPAHWELDNAGIPSQPARVAVKDRDEIDRRRSYSD
jgi:hypothetical protein